MYEKLQVLRGWAVAGRCRGVGDKLLDEVKTLAATQGATGISVIPRPPKRKWCVELQFPDMESAVAFRLMLPGNCAWKKTSSRA
jgi:hypothetical protein